MSISVENSRVLLRTSVLALLCVWGNAFAQVSNVVGLKTLEGVSIPKAQINKEIKPGATFKDCNECPVMVVIPAGSFLMGSPPNPDQDPFSDKKPVKISDDNERPQHTVQIQSFALGKFEITQEEWYSIMGTNPSSNKGRTLPVENVSWNEAQLFVQKLSQKTGKNYRLPTEAEWEYAVRGGSITFYPWGDSSLELQKYAWLNTEAESTNPVGLKKSNQFGLHDMLGNVREWVEDCWNKNYIGARSDGLAWTEGDCGLRVQRGGSFFEYANSLRSSFRNWSTTDSRYKAVGFRVARSN